MAKETTNQLAQLRAENQRLKRENARLKSVSSRRSSLTGQKFLNGLRSTAVVILLGLSVAMLSTGNIVFWTGRTIVDTDKYMNTVSPLIKDPQIQDAVALYATNQLFARVDVQKWTEQALPPRAEFLAPQLTTQLRSRTDDVIKKIIARPDVQKAWLNVQRRQHDRLINVAADYKGDGTITLNDVYQRISANLKDTKLSFLSDKKLPSNVGSVTVVTASWLPAFHKLVTHINTWRNLAIGAVIVCLALSLALARRRRRILYVFGWATAGTMLATLVSIRVTRQIIGGQVDSQYAEAVKRAVQIVLHPLVIQSVVIMVLALLLVAVVAAINGKFNWVGRGGKHIWSVFDNRVKRDRDGWHTLPAIKWLQANKRPVEYAIGTVTAIGLLLISPTIFWVVTLLLVCLVLIVAIEVIIAPARK